MTSTDTVERERLIYIAEEAIDNVHDMDVTLRDYARAATDAIIAALPDMVVPLDWDRGIVDWATPHPGMKYVACSSDRVGTWSWWLDGEPETRKLFSTEDEAKAAAQADYTRRIMSALGTDKGEG